MVETSRLCSLQRSDSLKKEKNLVLTSACVIICRLLILKEECKEFLGEEVIHQVLIMAVYRQE